MHVILVQKIRIEKSSGDLELYICTYTRTELTWQLAVSTAWNTSTVYIKASLFVCLFVPCMFLPDRELDHHWIQSAYSVDHGKETDGASFDRLPIGGPFGFVGLVQVSLRGYTFYRCNQCMNRHVQVHLNGLDKLGVICLEWSEAEWSKGSRSTSRSIRIHLGAFRFHSRDFCENFQRVQLEEKMLFVCRCST